MAPKTPATTTQVTKVDLPKWVDQAAKSNYVKATEIAGKDYKAFDGPDVADTSNLTTSGYKYMTDNADSTLPLMSDAAALQGRAATGNDSVFQQAQGILSGTAGPWDPTSYLNPYTNEVEQRATDNANRNLSMSISTAGDKARKAGAFGGSASAIEKGIIASEGARTVGDMSAELRRAGYDKATADLLADRASKQKTAEGMMTGAATQNKGWLDSATGLLSTADVRDKSIASTTAGLLTAGKDEQAQRQALIDAKKGRFNDRKNFDLENLNVLLASLGMTPYGKTETVNKTGTSESQGTDFATVGLGLAQMLLPMLSDRRDKKDIEKLGDDEETGLPIYAYRYKDAPASSIKVVGPMAQDVEKKYPEAVTEIGGHKVILPASILAAA